MIIADDEPCIREGLQALINWEMLGFDVVGSAGDGREALDLWKSVHAELVITDIRMTGGDGLDLMQRIRAQDNSVQFIVISGYDEFTFAKESIKYDVWGYLLKPVDRRELIECLKKGYDQLLHSRVILDEGDMNRRLEWSNEALFSALKNGAKDDVRHEIDKTFDRLTTGHASYLLIQWILSDILSYILVKLQPDSELRCACVNYMRETFNTYSISTVLSQAKAALQTLCAEMCDQTNTSRRCSKQSIRIDAIEEYIRCNYASQLSLRSVAAVFYVNPVYLGQMFRRATGLYFNEYLNRFRMERAVDLMGKTSLSLSEIASETGYNNQVSFYRVFKGMYDTNPDDFRKRKKQQQKQENGHE